MKRLTILSLLFSLTLCNCDISSMLPSNYLNRSWKYAHMDETDLLDSTQSGMTLHRLNSMLEYGNIHFYYEGNYTYVGNHISRLAHWSFSRSDSSIVVDSFIDNKPLRLRMDECTDQWLRCSVTNLGSEKVDGRYHPLLFAAEPYFEYKEIDLLKPEMNQWRIKPAHKESKAEIKKRVLGNIDYMIAYYRMIEEDHRTSFMPGYLQTTLKFYQNAMATEREENINQGWIDCYYDREDALTGWKMMGDALTNMPSYPKADSFAEGYMKALKLMKEYLERVNS